MLMLWETNHQKTNPEAPYKWLRTIIYVIASEMKCSEAISSPCDCYPMADATPYGYREAASP